MKDGFRLHLKQEKASQDDKQTIYNIITGIRNSYDTKYLSRKELTNIKTERIMDLLRQYSKLPVLPNLVSFSI